MLTIESYYSDSLQRCTCDNCKHGPKMPKDVCLTCTVYKPGYGCWLPYVNWEPKEECPICDSAELQYVYYAPSAKDEPTLLEDIDNNGFSPLILLKRIECKKCGASLPSLTDAISYLNEINDNTNHRYVLKRIGVDDVLEVEQ